MRRRRYTHWFVAGMMLCIMANIGIFVTTAVLQTKLAEPPKVESSYCRDFDTDPPVLTLIGPNPQTVVVGEEYFEHGAVVADNCGDFRVTVLGEVDVASAGEYEVAYEATDLAGNRGETLRLVRVVPANRGTIYLTFDDGPSQYTAKLLDVLAKYNVKASFFVTGRGADEMIAREYSEGHAVGLHSFSHDYAEIYKNPDAFFDDLSRIAERVRRITGEEPRLLRFPGGSSNTVSRKYDNGQRIMSYLVGEVERRGFTYFDWNVVSGDAGQTKDPDVIFHNVMNGLKEGGDSVVLQHDIKDFSVDAVERIILEAMKLGYTFGKLRVDSYPAHHGVNN